MNEDTTQRLPQPNSFEERVLAELAALRNQFNTFDARLTSLEDKVESRLHDTRPIWEAVLARLDNIEGELKTNTRNVKLLHTDILRVRLEQEELRERIEQLETEAAR